MILDTKLTWKLHVDFMLDRCSKALNFLKSIAKTWWGADVETCLLFYRSYIRSIIDYGSVLYGSASKNILGRIDVFLNTVLRCCIGAMRSTPIEPLYVETMEPPTKFRREYLSQKFLLKIRCYNTCLYKEISTLNYFDLTNKYWAHKNSPPLCDAFRNTADNNTELAVANKVVDFEDFFELLNQVDIIQPSYHEHSLLNSIVLNNYLTNWSKSVCIYTDASKSSNGTGCAFYIPDKFIEKMFKLPSNFSIFTAELRRYMRL